MCIYNVGIYLSYPMIDQLWVLHDFPRYYDFNYTEEALPAAQLLRWASAESPELWVPPRPQYVPQRLELIKAPGRAAGGALQVLKLGNTFGKLRKIGGKSCKNCRKRWETHENIWKWRFRRENHRSIAGPDFPAMELMTGGYEAYPS